MYVESACIFVKEMAWNNNLFGIESIKIEEEIMFLGNILIFGKSFFAIKIIPADRIST